MRITLLIDDDVLAVARALAEQQDLSIGKVISELAREGLETRRRPTGRHGRIPTFSPRRGTPLITNETVLDALGES